MTNIDTLAKHLLAERLTSADDLGKRVTAARRAAGEIRRQLARVAPVLAKGEQDTLNAAAQLLETIANATDRAKLQRKAADAREKKRREAAFKAVEQAFADVTDPAGVVALLMAGGSYRAHRLSGRELTAFDARYLMRDERREAVDHMAYRIATDSDRDVVEEATAVRQKFDQVRRSLEVKHAALIVQLQHALQDPVSSGEGP